VCLRVSKMRPMPDFLHRAAREITDRTTGAWRTSRRTRPGEPTALTVQPSVVRAVTLRDRFGELVELGAGDALGIEPHVDRAAAVAHPDVAALEVDLPQGLYLDGHYDEALIEFRHALDSWSKEPGPDAAKALNGIAAGESVKHDYAGALRDRSYALTLQTNAFGAQHPSVAYTVFNIGDVYLQESQKGDAALSAEQYRRALAMWEGGY
jgi:tetratricopeptide (TPR) repeat protein